MTITTLDGLVSALCASTAANGAFIKPFTPQSAGGWISLWAIAGHPGAGAAPSSGVAGDIPTDATAGSLLPFANPTAPVKNYLARFMSTSAVQGRLMLYDRLWQNSGLSTTTLTAQTVNSVALTRPDATGTMAEAWWQAYATMGASTTAPTISYTDQGGTSGATGTLLTLITGTAANRTYPFGLAAGDSGVASIQSYTNTATMTSGTFGLVLRRFIASIVVGSPNTGGIIDPLTGGLPVIPDDACLELLFQGASSANTAHGVVTLIQG